MDAVKFLEKYKRMCDSFENCANCPLLTEDCDNFKNQEFVKKAVQVVEEWSTAHPLKTRQSVFLEQYPEARVDNIGVLRVCPAIVSIAHRGNEGGCLDTSKECAVCRKEFWSQEVE